MHDPTAPAEPGRPRLLVPALGRLYGPLANPAETLLRLVAGLTLVTHGWPKIQDPFGAAGMVAGLGFQPANLWSLLLSVTEFVGGLCIALGLLTRFWAAGGFVVLCTTTYFHWIVQNEGWQGAQFSVVWASIMLFFVIRGSNRHSLDALIGRQL